MFLGMLAWTFYYFNRNIKGLNKCLLISWTIEIVAWIVIYLITDVINTDAENKPSVRKLELALNVLSYLNEFTFIMIMLQLKALYIYIG